MSQRRVCASMLRRCLSTRRNSSPDMKVVAINDVYELHNLPKLQSLINAEMQGYGGVFLRTLAGDFVSPSVLSGLDKGKSMIACLNHLSITHCCFGNHEADLQLNELAPLTRDFKAKWLNSNMPDFTPALPAWDVVEVPTEHGTMRVGIIGLLTSEQGILRKDTFRGLQIEDVVDASRRLSSLLRDELACHAVIALTHQSLGADEVLARAGTVDLILGGHEHVEMLVEAAGRAPIVKSRSDAQRVAVLSLSFTPSHQLQHKVEFKEVDAYPADEAMQREIDSHLVTLSSLEHEAVLSVRDSDLVAATHRAGRHLSSRRTRYEQTSVGTLLATAVRQYFASDVAMINGGSIKGDNVYPSGELNFLQLKKELPFPTKMVVVPMSGAVLQRALQHSRAGKPTDERRSYLQLCDNVEVETADHTIISIGGQPFRAQTTYQVALPRNLMKGAFNIQPLVDFAKDNPDALPSEDSFIPAMMVVVMQQAKRLWLSLGSFESLDLDHDGKITRAEIVVALRKNLGYEPSPILVDHVLGSLDFDGSGTISKNEHERSGDIFTTLPIGMRSSPGGD